VLPVQRLRRAPGNSGKNDYAGQSSCVHGQASFHPGSKATHLPPAAQARESAARSISAATHWLHSVISEIRLRICRRDRLREKRQTARLQTQRISRSSRKLLLRIAYSLVSVLPCLSAER
jgi:hypothetical protein